MSDEQRVQDLLDEILDSERTPEEVCRPYPELLAEVYRRWRQLRRVEAELGALFPEPGPAPSTGPPAPLHQGANLPRIPGYEVEAVLGRGGMGVVFQARHLKLKRLVAMKMLLAGAYAGPQELERFRREAEAVAALRHPNIVQIYDVSDLSGQPYFTMELIEGGSLTQRLSKKPFPPRQAAELVATLASAVQFAHKSGIIHRDLKPANILLTADGTPKITDFGLARAIEGGPEFTLSGARLGTPSYMAPEQALGKTSAIGPAADIYALGAVLYETLTGRPPFGGETAAETERQVIAEEPLPPSRLNAKVPRDLDTICLKCLQKNPARRYASAQDLADDLHRFLDGHPVVARPVGLTERAVKWARRRPTVATLVVTLLVSLAAALATGLALHQQKSSRQEIARLAIKNGIPKAYDLVHDEKWQEAKQVLDGLQRQLTDADSDDLRSRSAQAQADVQFAEQLERIRQKHVPFPMDISITGRAASQVLQDEFERAFAQANLNIDDAENMAAKIRASEVRAQTLAALDLWALDAFLHDNNALQTQLLRIAQLADPDPAWRDRFHDPKIWRDKKQLLKLGRDAATATPPIAAQQLAITGILLGKLGAKADSARLLEESLMRRPGDFWLNWEMGTLLLNQHRYKEAVACFHIVLALRPDNPWTMTYLSSALAGAGQMEESVTVARHAVELEPDNEILRYNFAVDLIQAKHFDEAEAECRRLLEANPKNTRAAYALGSTYTQSNRREEAISMYRRVLAIDPKHAPACYSLGAELVLLGRIDEAASSFEMAVKHDPGYLLGHVGLARTCMLQGKFRQAAFENKRIIVVLERDKAALGDNSTVDPEKLLTGAYEGWGEALCCLGLFTEARALGLHILDLPSMEDTRRQTIKRQLNLCSQLLPLEPKLSMIMAGTETPTDFATQRALALWFGKHRRLPLAAVRVYKIMFAKQAELVEDLNSQIRYDAACAAALAGCGNGEDAGKLNDEQKADMRQQALTWLKADYEAWATRHKSDKMDDMTYAARAVRAWQESEDLAGVRNTDALAKLPEMERREWESLWANVKALESRDPQQALDQAHEYLARKEWDKAVESYQRLIAVYPKLDGQFVFEYAAVQLLAGDLPGYRATCRGMLEGMPDAPKTRAYHVARAYTLSPESEADAGRLQQVSANELGKFQSAHWSLTEQGALLCRANKCKQAIPLLERSIEVEIRPGAAVLNWLWLAMANQKMGDKVTARRWLKKAQSLLDLLGNKMPANADALKLDYNNWLEAQILRQELEKLLPP